jgi:hypothetical protein
MIRKRLISAILLPVICLTLLSFGAFADGDATFAFDTGTGASLWRTENDTLIKDTGFKAVVNRTMPQDGIGSLAVSENLTKTLSREDAGNGTFFLASGSVGLESFAGCTISLSVYPVKEAMTAGAAITFFTDGMLYLPSDKKDWKTDSWNSLSISVPGNCDNTRVGFLVPLYSTYSGDVFYIDNVVITRPDGTAAPNVGDYQAPADGEGFSLPPIVMTILMVLLAGAGVFLVIFLIIFLIKHLKRFR